MAEAGSGRLALDLEVCEVAVHNLTVNDDRFEVAKLVLQLAFLVFATEVVDAFLDRVALRVLNNGWLATHTGKLTLP